MYAERLRRFYPSEPVPTARESKNIRDAIQCTRGYDVFKRLAELIDRPICHDIASHGGMRPVGAIQWFECSECGQELMFDWSGEYSWFEPEHPYKPIGLKYCPGCGARVLFPHPWLGSKEEG